MFKNLTLALFSLLLTAGCAKKQIVIPDPAVEIKNITEAETKATVVVEEITEIDIKIENAIETTVETAEKAPVAPDAPVAPQQSIKPSFDFDQVFPDSIWTDYMTKRGDYLSLIAYNEYGNANEWRRIYNWNKKHWEERGIGPNRENPNFIYPYRELDLKKPAANAIEWAYDYTVHTVSSGETLWTIAKETYGDELAWVVLFWDNEDALNDSDGKISPGMEIKVRSELFPEFDE
jgi:nucleoid-associated protein YgaU